MTREEIIQGLYRGDSRAIKEAIKALEQQPCEDAISRADAVKVASGYCHPSNIAKELAKLPPVTPKLTECEDAISRQAAIDALGEKPLDWTEDEYELGLQNQWKYDVDTIKTLPPVTPIRPKGHWIEEKISGHEVNICSHCQHIQHKEPTWHYCPLCGADMREVEE